MVANLSQLSHPEVLIEGLRNLENQETTVAVLPFFHIYAMNCIMTFGLRLGGKLVTVPRFEPEMYISCLVNYKVSILHTNTTESQITFTRTLNPKRNAINFFRKFSASKCTTFLTRIKAVVIFFWANTQCHQ